MRGSPDVGGGRWQEGGSTLNASAAGSGTSRPDLPNLDVWPLRPPPGDPAAGHSGKRGRARRRGRWEAAAAEKAAEEAAQSVTALLKCGEGGAALCESRRGVKLS